MDKSAPTLRESPPASLPKLVILSAAGTSRSEVSAKSKDPYTFSRPQAPQGILPVQPVFLARYSEPSAKLRWKKGLGEVANFCDGTFPVAFTKAEWNCVGGSGGHFSKSAKVAHLSYFVSILKDKPALYFPVKWHPPMTEIKDCLPEGARKHFIDLRNIRLEAETGKYRERLVELRVQIAAKHQGRSGWQEMEEWKYKEELWDSLARGYVEDAFETSRLYDIELTRPFCDCLVKATEELLNVQYSHALQTQAQGGGDVKIPLTVRQQGNLRSRKIMPQIRVMIEAARVEDEKKRVAIAKESRIKEASAIHIHNSNITTVGGVKSEGTKRKAPLSTNDKLVAAGVVVAVLAIAVGVLVPEVRRKLGLEPSPSPVSQTEAQVPKSEPSTIATPSPATPRRHNNALSANALALAANIRKLSQEWRTEQAKIDNASDVTDQQKKSMSSAWATKVMAEYDSKYKADARITHDQLVARLPVGTDPLAMKDDYENEVNPGLLEIIASNLEHLAKLLHGQQAPALVKPSQTSQIGGISQGAGSALSINQQGGITASTVNLGPPPPEIHMSSRRVAPTPQYGKNAREFTLTTNQSMIGGRVLITCENKIKRGAAIVKGGYMSISPGGGMRGDNAYESGVSAPNWAPQYPLVVTLYFDEDDLGACTFKPL